MTITATDVRRAAMDLLARREHGADELVFKLQRRFNKYRRNGAGGFSQDSSQVSSEYPSQDHLENPSQDFSPFPSENLFQTSPGELSAEQLIDLIHQEVQKLTDSGLQSNARLAEAFIRSRANRGQGPLKIRMELRQKGISDPEIDLAMAEAATDWQAIAIELAEKKFRLEDPDPKQRAKRQRFLQQRGFSFEHIQAVERR